MAKPSPKKGGRTRVAVNVSMTAEQAKRYRAYCEARGGLALSAFLRLAADEKIARDKS